MATILTPESPATDPRPTGDVRLSNIRANLMPDEVIIARRTEALRRQVLLALAIVLGIIIAGYVVSWWQTHQSNVDLDDANHRSSALISEQQQYAALVTAQNQTSAVQAQLVKLMGGDVQWNPMLTTLRATAPAGITLTNVDAKMSAGAAASTAQTSGVTDAVLNQSGKAVIGTLTINGTARDKKSVAAYADSLSKVKGLTAPYLANVANALGTSSGQITFTVDVLVTTDALGGRFSATTLGGK